MKPSTYFYAILTGFINSAIGSGGGMVCVPSMKKNGLTQKKAQATTIAVILPLTVFSAILYAVRGEYSPTDALKYIPFGFLGSIAGVKLTKKIKNKTLKKLFAVFMLYLGIRMLLG